MQATVFRRLCLSNPKTFVYVTLFSAAILSSRGFAQETIKYSGTVGSRAAEVELTWHADRSVTGSYRCPGGKNVTYQLRGRNHADGELYLEEYTGAILTARCLLTKENTATEVVWAGTLSNTDGRALPVRFVRHAGAPASKAAQAPPPPPVPYSSLPDPMQAAEQEALRGSSASVSGGTGEKIRVTVLTSPKVLYAFHGYALTAKPGRKAPVTQIYPRPVHLQVAAYAIQDGCRWYLSEPEWRSAKRGDAPGRWIRVVGGDKGGTFNGPPDTEEWRIMEALEGETYVTDRERLWALRARIAASESANPPDDSQLLSDRIFAAELEMEGGELRSGRRQCAENHRRHGPAYEIGAPQLLASLRERGARGVR
jgi:hypothetical protein